MRGMHAVMGVAVLTAFLVTGCAGGGAPSVEQRAAGVQTLLTDFYGAVGEDDTDAACAMLTPELRAATDDCAALADFWDELGSGTVSGLGEVVVDPDALDFATPTVTGSDGTTIPVPAELVDRFAWVYEDALTWPSGQRPEYDILLLVWQDGQWRIASVSNGGGFADHVRAYLEQRG